MAKINPRLKRKIESFLRMESGYVLNFSDRTLQDFILDVVGIDIRSDKYAIRGNSKANRIRTFFEIESNILVATLLQSLVDYALEYYPISSDAENESYQACLKVIQELKNDPNTIKWIQVDKDDENFEKLSLSIKEQIEKGQPEVALDRLHTFLIKFIRHLCENAGLQIEKDKPLHSLIGEYRKFLRANNFLESEMSDRIIASSISTLEAFNKVRNEQSLAHDNQLLNYDESLLIFKNITALVQFLQSIDKKIIAHKVEASSDNLPF